MQNIEECMQRNEIYEVICVQNIEECMQRKENRYVSNFLFCLLKTQSKPLN